MSSILGLIILLELAAITVMIVSHVRWQRHVLKMYTREPAKKKKIKLKKGQSVIFAEKDDINPFDGDNK